MTFRHIAIGVLVGIAGIAAAAVMAAAQEPPRPNQLVDALNGVFGKHSGDRAAHTKGICLTGQFVPSPVMVNRPLMHVRRPLVRALGS
jgi:catalase